MKILIVYPTFTHPINSGNKQWVNSQAELLIKLGHDVHMLCINIPGMHYDKQNNQKAYKLTKNIWKNKLQVYNASIFERIKSSIVMNYRKYTNDGYYNCDDLYPNGLTEFVNKLNLKENFDACIVNYYWLSKLLENSNIPITAINTHDVFSFRNIATHSKTAWMCTYPNEEAIALQRAKYIFALQDEEASYFTHLSPNSQILKVYCPYKIHDYKFLHNHNLVMLASSNPLNVAGFKWFYKNIFPDIIANFPDVKFVIGGYICEKIKEICSQDKHIKLIGTVDDPRDLYEYGDIAINPCTDGTGLKIKTFEALSYGKIVMTHPHSVKVIYNKMNAPVFYSKISSEWIDFLKTMWSSDTTIIENKCKESINYIKSMNEYIIEQYHKFTSFKK